MKKKAPAKRQAPPVRPDNGIAVQPKPTVTMLDSSTVENVLLNGDLSRLPSAARVAYYNRVCESLGLNPLTKPFDYLKLNGREILYAKRDATEQLRKIHGVSITEVSSQFVGDVFVVTAKAQDARGRLDASTGAVPIHGLKGEGLANALMKAETKAKRRVTLSICGLGMLDESELDTMPVVQIAKSAPIPERAVTGTPDAVNVQTGEVAEVKSAPPPTNHTGDLRPITTVNQDGKGKGQLGRLIVICNKSGRKDEEIKAWLKAVYGWTSRSQITREAYEAVCAAIEKPGPLPMPTTERDPGEEG